MSQLTLNILKQLHTPSPTSHKGQNGILYTVAGSQQYHGSLWYAVELASHFVDLIYVETDPSNRAMIQSLKKLHPAIILVSSSNRKRYLAKSNCVVLGPGLGRGTRAKKIVHSVLTSKYCSTKRVIDADALYYLSPNFLTKDTVLTPHAGEYRALFGDVSPDRASKSVPAVIVAKGARTEICQNGKCDYNTRGNAGLTKGGTGDVLASLIAALSCTNPVWLASRAASVAEGEAAISLSKHTSTHFSTLELIQHIPKILHKYQ